ncbi:MAG: YfhO family protein [Elusimicrobiota bacterium]
MFLRLRDPLWMFVGDTLSSFARYSFHYSSLARGEYPLWNPLVRCGEPAAISQVVGGLANPLQNLITAGCVLSGVRDIAFAFLLCIYAEILLYAAGVYLLAREWTNDSHAGAFAGMLAIASSAVFFHVYHVTFIMLIHWVPWVLFSVSAYSRRPGIRYILLFSLAACQAIYSYEVVIGGALIVFMAVSALLVYRPGPRAAVRAVPIWHWLLLGGLIALFAFPAALMYFHYAPATISPSRTSGITLTDAYAISCQPIFERITSREWLNPGFWVVMFTGITGPFSEQILRHCAGPLALPMLVVALASLRRLPWVLALSGLMVACMAGGLPPADWLYQAPIFGLIRNGHFLLQGLVFSIILLAGIGFHELFDGRAPFKGKMFSAASFAFIAACIVSAIVLNRISLSSHDAAALLLAALSAACMLFCFFRLPPEAARGWMLGASAAVTILSMTLTARIPVLAGRRNDDPLVNSLRNRIDYGLHFASQRPEAIDKVNLAHQGDAQTDFGIDEYSSYVTLRDNSFKSAAKQFGLSSYPMLEQTLRFSLLSGAAEIARKKFLWLTAAFISDDEADMGAFRRTPIGLSSLVDHGIGLADALDHGSLGPFDQAKLNRLPQAPAPIQPDVEVGTYRANSISLRVSAKQSGLLVYTDSWDPDWQARLDGKRARIVRVLHTFKGVEVPAGQHEIRFDYRSRVFLPILTMHVVFTAALLALLRMVVRARD